MPIRHCRSFIRFFAFIVFILICGLTGSIALGQGAKQKLPDATIPDSDADHVQQRNEWFFRGRLVPRKPQPGGLGLRPHPLEKLLRDFALQLVCGSQTGRGGVGCDGVHQEP